MSNRRKAVSQPTSNPATKFFEWKSNDKCFVYFDKSIADSMEGKSKDEIREKANIKVKNLTFLYLDELSTVKGWNDGMQSGIYSNEVKYISKEPMNVRLFKGGEIAKGLYKDIKDKIVAAGAHYVKSIYIMLEDGSLANIQLKGSGTQAWGNFTAKVKNRLPDEWITVEGTIDGKKGAVKYSMPEFKFLRSLSEAEAEQADEAFDTLEAYLKTYLVKAPNEIEVVDEEEVHDDLDF